MNSLRGHLLIATPGLRDPDFARTVLLVLEHDEGGAMGVVLNRPTGATLSDLAGKVFEEGFVWDRPIHLGGPVTGPFAVIHAIEDLADREVIPGVYHTVEATKVQEIISRKPEPSLAVANYAGWGPGQLEGEFDEGSWLTLPATRRARLLVRGQRPLEGGGQRGQRQEAGRSPGARRAAARPESELTPPRATGRSLPSTVRSTPGTGRAPGRHSRDNAPPTT